MSERGDEPRRDEAEGPEPEGSGITDDLERLARELESDLSGEPEPSGEDEQDAEGPAEEARPAGEESIPEHVEEPEEAPTAESGGEEPAEGEPAEGEPAEVEPAEVEPAEVEPAEVEPVAGAPEPVADGSAEADIGETADAAEAAPPPAAGPVADPQPTPARPATPVEGTARESLAAAVAGAPNATVGADADDDLEIPARRGPLWPRFLAGTLVIVVSMATATAVSIMLYLSDIAEGLGDHKLRGVESRLANVDGGDPQTILILGSDKRAGDDTARSDTTMLLRVDPDRNAIALFSLPRDLKVSIPGVGIDRLNAAYTAGGPQLALRTVQQVTGLDINHLVNVDFAGFGKAVNAIDCVYVDVDRRYFHSNEGLPPEAQYAEIDIGAGYRRLCGARALDYVRFRHTDNDIVRAARQQDFLREARQKVDPGRLWRDRDQLIDIFTEHTTSDVDDPRTMLEVLKLFIEARNAQVREIHFQGGFDEEYVTASDRQIKQAVGEFLGTEGTSGPRGGEAANEPDNPEAAQQERKKGKKKSKEEPVSADDAALIDSGPNVFAFAEEMRRKKHFPVFYPKKILPGSIWNGDSVGYSIPTPDGQREAYKIVLRRDVAGISEYYGIMGTSWLDPPILENPSETREIDGNEYMIFYDGDRLRLVGFQTSKGSYWVSNTLQQSLSEAQMLGVATSMKRFK